MNTPYTLLNVARVVSGAGSLECLPQIVADLGARRVLIISDKGVARAGLLERPRVLLEAAGMTVTLIDDTPPEPDVNQVEAILAMAKQHEQDLVIGIGGGSAMDVAKLIAVLLSGELLLSQLLDKTPVTRRGLPTLMVPTTAGTGSEATPNSIVLVPASQLKVGIVSAQFMPDCVILDPELTLGLPPAITASTGMDALCHAIECFTSRKHNPFSDMLALEAIRLISRSILTAFRHGGDLAARQDMMLGAFYGGMCIATSSTTAVHALAYPLGGKYRMPHGISNAILLPWVMRFNASGNAAAFRPVAQAMGLDVAGLDDDKAATLMVEQLFVLNRELEIPANLAQWKITGADLDGLVEGATAVTRLLDNNPRSMSRDDIRAIYQQLI